MLGIIGAMEEEVNEILALMKVENEYQECNYHFYEGFLGKKEVVVVQGGIGKVNAGICTQILVDDYDVDAVINTGIAGSLNKDIDIGDIVLSTDTLEHDMDAVSFGYPLGQIPRMNTLSFTADEHLRKVAKESCDRVLSGVKVFEGRVVSGDQFVSSHEKKDWLVETFGGYCTEMEGAAIAHAAYLNNIPFLIIRAISDKADDSASMDYPAFEKMAIANSVTLILEMAGNL